MVDLHYSATPNGQKIAIMLRPQAATRGWFERIRARPAGKED